MAYKKSVASIGLCLLFVSAAPALAQGIVPIISPGQAAEDIFTRSRTDASSQTQRDHDDGQPQARTVTPDLQKQACENRAQYRRQYGEDSPQIQRLESLCKDAGY